MLVGSSAWLVNLTLVSQLNLPEGPTKVLEGLINELPLVPTILAIAVLPAVAEEIVFRGVLARSLARQHRPWLAVVMSAAVFGIYHLVPQQVVATFLLGCLLGFFTLRSRSLLPAMVIHFLNNAIAVVVSRDGTGWLERHAAASVIGASVLTAAGIALALASPRGSGGLVA